MEYKTEQEKFWAGKFGDNYIERNSADQMIDSRIAMLARMLRAAGSVTSVLELGCNVGLNLVALRRLNPSVKLSGYEINKAAAEKARQFDVADIHEFSILEPIEKESADLVFTSGVLIHINPDYLENVYENLVRCSNRYVLVAEYFNPSPVQISYRGNENVLFKRDFAGEIIDRYGLNLVDYGFVYRRDNWVKQDDITWFLLEK